MSGYLATLVERASAPAILPRPRTAFEPLLSGRDGPEFAREQGHAAASESWDASGARPNRPRGETPAPRVEDRALSGPPIELPHPLDPQAQAAPSRAMPGEAPARGEYAPRTPALSELLQPANAPADAPAPASERKSRETALKSRAASSESHPEPALSDTARAASAPSHILVRPSRITQASSAAADENAARRFPNDASSAAPSVKVTIGRVEVRANFLSAPALPRAAASNPRRLSLEDYLLSRNGGKR